MIAGTFARDQKLFAVVHERPRYRGQSAAGGRLVSDLEHGHKRIGLVQHEGIAHNLPAQFNCRAGRVLQGGRRGSEFALDAKP